MRIQKELGEAVAILLQPYTERKLTVELIEEMLKEKEFLPEPKSESLLSRKEAAMALHVSVSTIDRMLRDGELVPRRVRGRVFIRQSDVDGVLRGGWVDKNDEIIGLTPALAAPSRSLLFGNTKNTFGIPVNAG